jgi:hypothetical protein
VLESWVSPNNFIRKYFLDMKHRWNLNAFWDVNNKKWRKLCMFVSPFLFSYTYCLTVLRKDTNCPNHIFFVSLVDLQAICAKYGLETWFSPHDNIRKCLLVMMHIWTKNEFWDVNNKKWRKWCIVVSLFSFNYCFGAGH